MAATVRKSFQLFSRLISREVVQPRALCTTPALLCSSNRLGEEPWNQKYNVSGGGEKLFGWPAYNERVYLPDGTHRPAFVTHMRALNKYSPQTMWYLCSFVRGMPVEEAITQLGFIKKKGAVILKEVLLEAQEIAVKEHNVEFKTNMWVAEAFANKGKVIKGFRRHARGRMGEVRYMYTHVFVRLEEGKPPKHYYEHLAPQSPQEMLEGYIEEQRKKTIPKH